jgi:hypothetical protein
MRSRPNFSFRNLKGTFFKDLTRTRNFEKSAQEISIFLRSKKGHSHFYPRLLYRRKKCKFEDCSFPIIDKAHIKNLAILFKFLHKKAKKLEYDRGYLRIYFENVTFLEKFARYPSLSVAKISDFFGLG